MGNLGQKRSEAQGGRRGQWETSGRGEPRPGGRRSQWTTSDSGEARKGSRRGEARG